MALRKGIYIVPTDHWYIERTVWLIAGVVLLTGTTLAALVHPLAVLLVIATGLASITVSLTGFCIMANGLYWLGAEPRLAPDGANVTSHPEWSPASGRPRYTD